MAVFMRVFMRVFIVHDSFHDFDSIHDNNFIHDNILDIRDSLDECIHDSVMTVFLTVKNVHDCLCDSFHASANVVMFA